ncbi:Uroporphyrinogen decarboxylase [Neolecta irregularis DAH-3]|uniref:Uroporphyrinogen decarboxylase n=1 Tax=Neolecta irregularis (strain DAH-3) TaxID=1198029 RepID=A0A1U7LKP1_NEOID|nr:Uroporphyrinogen decarboxylase [Neolecta irregularis DAH-3]|eukprot:OLL23226.1 Uroporphyrinogen decarboxylase [Neolecta irregularis DAH-3]
MMTNFPILKNDLLLRAAKGEKVERFPCWIMRQAGRYLPEYHEIRGSHDFFTVCQTPSLACAITLQPINRYADIDAAIIFSDILVIPQALGMEVVMEEKRGPVFPEPLVVPMDLKRLHRPDVKKELDYVFKALRLTRTELNGRVPLIGFCGAPWTLMSYMIEGGGSKSFAKVKSWIFAYEKESLGLLNLLTDVCVDFLVEQVHAGAQMLQVFDSWAGELSPSDFQTFSLPFLRRIATETKQRLGENATPMTVFAKGAWYALDILCSTDYDVIGLDWTHDPAEAEIIVRGRKVLQGNLDPGVLYGSDETMKRKTGDMLGAFNNPHILNLGHGITPGVNPEMVSKFLRECHIFFENKAL